MMQEHDITENQQINPLDDSLITSQAHNSAKAEAEPHAQLQAQANDNGQEQAELKGDAEADDNGALVKDFAEEVKAYVEKCPDFTDAFSYLVELRDKQLRSYSNIQPCFKDLAVRNKQIEAEAMQILQLAKEQRVNAAQFLYDLANSYGYKRAPAMNDNREAIQNAAKTLTATSGSLAGAPMNLESLANLTQEEFDEWYWANKKDFKRIMGY